MTTDAPTIEHLQRFAVISDCGTYRYRLERDLGVGRGTIAGIMVNPSTADGVADDATIRKWIGFAKRSFIRRIIIGNKFAFRATDVKKLRTAPDAIGPENDRHLEGIMREAELVVVAWGPLAKLPPNLRDRWRDVVAIAERLDKPLHCYGVALDRHPRHPLMLSYTCALSEWRRP